MSTDIIVHVCLGEYVEANYVLDPAPQIAILREERRKNPAVRITLACVSSRRQVEENYLKLFEEFNPVVHYLDGIDDFILVVQASQIIVSHPAFSWLAASLATPMKRWIPVSKGGETLGKVSDTDILYEADWGYDMKGLEIPTEPIVPVTGEFLQSLCEYTILDHFHRQSFHTWIDIACPPERQFFIEDEWPPEVFNATSLFVYPSSEGRIGRHVYNHTWPNLRLLIFHNSDYGVDYEGLLPFLERNPTVYVWAQNATRWHPRIKSAPIGEQNRMWRGGVAGYEPTVSICRSPERSAEITISHWSNTHPSRLLWAEQAAALRRPGVHRLRPLSREDYLEMMEQSRAIVCPRGNGADTHRHWEALTKGAWAIVEENAHTQTILRDYPSLPFLPVADMDEVETLKIPAETPSPFHPLLLRAFWTTLFRSYMQKRYE